MRMKLTLPLTSRTATIGRLSIAWTGLLPFLLVLIMSLVGFPLKALSAYPSDRDVNKADVIEIMALLTELQQQPLTAAQMQEQATQILESSVLPTLYHPFYQPNDDEFVGGLVPMSVSTWRILSNYFRHAGFMARTIHSVQNPRSFIYSGKISDCILEGRDCDYRGEMELNMGYMFGLFGKKTIPLETIYQEVRGFLNSQILMANTDICKLMKEGLPANEVYDFIAALRFLDHDNPYEFANQRISGTNLLYIVDRCVPGFRRAYENGPRFMEGQKCEARGNRISCKKTR